MDERHSLSVPLAGSLELAEKLGLSSIAFPAISTGIFGFPKERAARLMLDTIAAFIDRNPQSCLQLVRLTLYDPPTLSAFVEQWSACGYSWFPSHLAPDDHLHP